MSTDNVETVTTGVLIVGGGPTGLTLANVLGHSDVPFMLVDQKPTTITEPRAVSIDDESLRTMQAVGLADAVMKDVVPGYGVHYFDRPGGTCFARVEPTVSEYGFPGAMHFVNRCSKRRSVVAPSALHADRYDSPIPWNRLARTEAA